MCNYNEMIFILAILKKHDKKKLMMNKWITECKVREFAKCRDKSSAFFYDNEIEYSYGNKIPV